MAVTSHQHAHQHEKREHAAEHPGRKRKVIVAVHGIGDQVEFATIQSVISRVYDYCYQDLDEAPVRVPLGHLHTALKRHNPDDKERADIPAPPGDTPAAGAPGGFSGVVPKTPPAESDDDPQGSSDAASDLDHDHKLYFPREEKSRLPLPNGPSEMGFAEVYWADIVRAPARAGYTLEETKQWTATLISRIGKFDDSGKGIRYDRIQLVLDEMVEAIRLADGLTGVLEKLRVPFLKRVELNRVLNDFLGDVQFVTEFGPYRDKILDRFDETMEAARLHEDDEVYVVAHSEGTVVALLAILRAFRRRPEPPAWARQIAGLMTIGSPIDKHLVLWPDIWRDPSEEIACGRAYHRQTQRAAQLAVSAGSDTDADAGGDPDADGERPVTEPSQRIRWWNYYDYGDPVGYKLDTARTFLRHRGRLLAPGESAADAVAKLRQAASAEGAAPGHKPPPPPLDMVFEMSDETDHGFTRYKLPGQAHNDYWDDNDVFGHFLSTVVRPTKARPVHKPPTRIKARLLSYVLPYLLAFAVLVGGVYLLDKGVVNSFPEATSKAAGGGGDGVLATAGHVLGLSLLLAGATVVSRVPRLTIREHLKMGLIAVGVFVLFAWAYYYLATITPALSLTPYREALFARLGEMEPISDERFAIWQIMAATVVAGVGYLAGKLVPSWGLKPLVAIGGIALATLIAARFHHEEIEAPLWPLLLAFAAFLYLWRLAALTFDLTFIWHRYIRSSRASEGLAENCSRRLQADSYY